MFCLLFLLSVVQGYTVHEWGTYTSSQDSNGRSLPGLHHGEVRDLPSFVHSRAHGQSPLNAEMRRKMSDINKRGIVPPGVKTVTGEACGFCKVMDWVPAAGTPAEVTQKLETPVIYFYSSERIDNVRVAVDFPKGIITEAYPQTSLNLPLQGQVQATASGHAEWNVTVHELGARLSVPPVDPTNIWAPSRRVNSNFVQSFSPAGIENERHIFYRGLARFDGPIRVTSTMTELTVENLSDEEIPAAWVLSSDGVNAGIIRCLCSIAPRSKVSTPLTNGKFDLSDKTESLEMELYLLEAGVKLEGSLMQAGLTALEARAMVDTWSSNYFKSYGTRVLYIAPESYPDQLLPWKIVPTPQEETRVYVGRIETQLLAEEEEFRPVAIRAVQDHYTPSQKTLRENDLQKVYQLGRFAEAKMRAVLGDAVPKQQFEDFIFRELTYDRE